MSVWVRVDRGIYDDDLLLYLKGMVVNTNGTLFGWNRNYEKLVELYSYSSKEKAQKVLDMIQDHIKNRVNEDMVFELPSDDEVEL